MNSGVTNTGILRLIADIRQLSCNVVCQDGYLLVYRDSNHPGTCVCLIYDVELLTCNIDLNYPMHFIVLGNNIRLTDWGVPAEMITWYPFSEECNGVNIKPESQQVKKIFYVLENVADDPHLSITLSVLKAFNCLLHLRFCFVVPEAAIDKLTSVANEHITFIRHTDDYLPHLSECRLWVASGRTAVKALLSGIPVIAAGNYGFGGLITEDNLPSFISSHFLGRPGGNPGDRISTVSLVQEVMYALEIMDTAEMEYLLNISADNRRRLENYCRDTVFTLIRQLLAEKDLLGEYIDDDVLFLQLKPVTSRSIYIDKREESSGLIYWLRNVNTNKVLAVVGDDEMKIIFQCNGCSCVQEIAINVGEEYDREDCAAFVRSLWKLRVLVLNI